MDEQREVREAAVLAFETAVNKGDIDVTVRSVFEVDRWPHFHESTERLT